MNAENTTVINPENYSAIPCNQEKLPKVSFHEFRYTLDTDNGPVRFDTQCFRKNFSGKQDGAENSDEITFSMNISEEDEHFYVQPTLSGVVSISSLGPVTCRINEDVGIMNGNTDRPSVAVAGIALPTYVTPEILDGVFFPDDLKKLISGIVVNGIERPRSIHPDLQKAFTSQGVQDVIDSALVDDSVIRVMENPNSNFYNKQNAILEKHAFDHPIWTSVEAPWEMGFFGNKISYQNKNDMDLDSDIAMHFIVDEVSRLMEERDVRSKHMEVLQYLSTIVDFEYEEHFATMGANALKGVEHVALKDLMEGGVFDNSIAKIASTISNGSQITRGGMVDIVDSTSENFDIYGESKDGIVTYCLKIGEATFGGYKTEERAEKDRDRFFVFMVAEAKKVLTKWNEVIDFEEDDDVAAIANEIIGQVSNKELSEAMASEKFDNQIIEVADIFALGEKATVGRILDIFSFNVFTSERFEAMKIGYGVDGGHDLIISGERFAGYEHKYMAARDQQLFMKFLVARAIDEGSISPGATIIK